MAPKPFSLDSVLKFRKRQEDIAQEQFIRKQREADEVKDRLVTAKDSLATLIISLEKLQIRGVSIAEFARYEERKHFEQVQVDELSAILIKKQKAVQKKRQILIEKVKEHKTLTTLKEQQNKNWKDYINKKEAAMLDEIAILHHDRNRD